MRVREAVAEGADGDEGAGCGFEFFVWVFFRRGECWIFAASEKSSTPPMRSSPNASLLALPSEPRRTARASRMSVDFTA